MSEDYAFGPVRDFDACQEYLQCRHCATGRPAAPAEAGRPWEDDAVGPEIDAVLRFALPPAYHRPAFLDSATPTLWVCAACWDDNGTVTQWPCTVATVHGKYVYRSMRLAVVS